MANIPDIESVLLIQRTAIQDEIKRLRQELKKVDAMIQHSKSGAQRPSGAQEVLFPQPDQSRLSDEIFEKSLTEQTRDHIRSILPRYGRQGGSVKNFADSVRAAGIPVKNPMVSTILWRLADSGEIERYGTKRNSCWRLTELKKTSGAVTPEASETAEDGSSVNESEDDAFLR